MVCISDQSDCYIRVYISHQSYHSTGISCTNHSIWVLFSCKWGHWIRGLCTKNDIKKKFWAHLISVMVTPFCNHYLVSSRKALSLQRGIDGDAWRDQKMATKETTVGVAPMHFIFAQKYWENRENKPQNTRVSSDESIPFFFLLFLLRKRNMIFSSVWSLCSFSVSKMRTLGSQHVPFKAAQTKKKLLHATSVLNEMQSVQWLFSFLSS